MANVTVLFPTVFTRSFVTVIKGIVNVVPVVVLLTPYVPAAEVIFVAFDRIFPFNESVTSTPLIIILPAIILILISASRAITTFNLGAFCAMVVGTKTTIRTIAAMI